MSTKAEKKPAIFEAAIALETEEQREAYLERACPDEGLRREVAALLRAHDSPDSLILQTDQVETLETQPLLERPGTVIDRYKLLQQIGEGGMGVDTKSVVARFEAERQALALMDHPAIARVLDGGKTESGRPCFVMELVKRAPITEFADKNKLDARARLDLFTQVCRAVQSAHQKGIIHRDLKPSNILVTLHHGEPLPKIIDFGIAKATNQKLTEKTLFTNFAQMIGPPAYMSPEQAEVSSMDIDTRTDVYSLGVLLYELLTGTTPFPEKELLSKGYGEMQRIIAEQEPERPSLRMSTLVGEQQSIVPKNRAGDLPLLTKKLRGDLDWIIMKALEKDRTRRYETANGLAEDVRRHLNDEPVLAAKPSFRYQLAKLYHRNKPAFAAAQYASIEPLDQAGEFRYVLYEIESGREIVLEQGKFGSPRTLNFNEDGSRLIAGGLDYRLHVWDTSTGAYEGAIEGHPGEIWDLALRPLRFGKLMIICPARIKNSSKFIPRKTRSQICGTAIRFVFP